ncbi:lipase family protein [Nocardia blacklockiae]|uniref:lipase family protein n=1 Tax=Nocardia blacklockiae TaxID=480036 RepID=UPI001894D815|nr:lipase family protein [Nocardia blacklockiae]MBF6171842.1 triacylglycerol lipase [Nocardia blacklockiae]
MRTALGRRVLPLAAVCALLVSAFGGTAVAAPEFPPSFPPDQNQLPQLPREPDIYDALPIPVPDRDSWYDDPPNLAELRPGDIIRSREVQTRLLGIPVPVFSKQLLFRSTDVHGAPIATATTVIVPGIPWVGSPRPVVSFQEAIDSTDSACNPSHTLQTGTFKEIALAQFWIAQGFAFNVPDFDGKFNTFNTYDEGQMVLDSLRAMKNDAALGLRDSGIALYGFSGGGSATARAAELRQSYAPDVHIAGAAFGGAPPDLTAIADYATVPRPGVTGISSFTMWLGAAALAREFPDEFDPARLLNPEGRRIIADLQSRCVYSAALTGMYRPISEYYAPGSQGLNDPAIQRVLRSQSLGKQIPDIPLLWWNGVWDELIPSSIVLPTVNDYWQRGADLRYYTMPLPEHLTNAVAGWLPATAWISALLRGLPPGPKFKLDYPSPLPPGFPGA